LLGFIQKHQGDAFLFGLNCFKDSVEIQKHIGYLPGEINFIDDLNGK